MELGRYRILSQLGQGGMATVYLGEDPLLNRLVAIKVIQAHLTSNTSLTERFTVEAKTIAALRNVNIVEIFDFGIQDDQQYLVMEYIDGQSLQMVCTALDAKPMSNTVAAAIICQAAEGLTSAEKNNVVHRDIKPENLLFNSEGVLKIADFGIAHIANEQSRTQTGAVLGSPNFMSPEQIEGVKPTHKTDLFSLGGVFYYCLTGKLPFTGTSIPVTMRNICDKPHPPILSLNPQADPFLVQIIDGLLSKEPAARGDGARALANQLRGWLTRNEVVDLVEHSHTFITGLGIVAPRPNPELPPTGFKGHASRPGSGMAAGAKSGNLTKPRIETPLRPGSSIAPKGTIYSGQPTTGAMGPSSRSPLVWVGAFLTAAILVLAAAVFWTLRPGKNPNQLTRSTLPIRTVVEKPIPPKILPAPIPSPNPSSLAVINETAAPLELEKAPKTAEEPVLASVAATQPSVQPPKPEKQQVEVPKIRPKPIVRPVVSPAPAPLGKTGFLMIKSAPPFAAIAVNGRPEGETPMSSWLEVPAGKYHIEIIHRLTPPFDTMVTVTPGSRQEFKFKLER